jgi:phenylpyruvate tautomerase PptA (4-oxalocrotonate tautomerase family)
MHIAAGLSEPRKRQLIHEIVQVTHEAIGSDPKIINVVLHEHPAVNLSVSGRLEGEIAASATRPA